MTILPFGLLTLSSLHHSPKKSSPSSLNDNTSFCPNINHDSIYRKALLIFLGFLLEPVFKSCSILEICPNINHDSIYRKALLIFLGFLLEPVFKSCSILEICPNINHDPKSSPSSLNDNTSFLFVDTFVFASLPKIFTEFSK